MTEDSNAEKKERKAPRILVDAKPQPVETEPVAQAPEIDYVHRPIRIDQRGHRY